VAVQVGSPKLMQMLYVITAADLGAVGPGVWDGWKQEVVTDLYHRTMQHLAGESPETTIAQRLGERRTAVCALLGEEARQGWFAEHLNALPTAYLSATVPEQIADDLRLLHGMAGAHQENSPADAMPAVAVVARYQSETDTVQWTVATTERIAEGIFYRLTGAFSSRGLEIRSAQIHTLPDGLVLDRFSVHDPDFSGEPPVERLDEVREA